MRKVLLSVFGFLLTAGPAAALNKEEFAVHIRKALNLDTRVQITVGDPAPAGFADLNVIDVSIQGNKYPIYISKDEKKYIWGQLVDNTVDPDVERMKAISLTNVHSKGPANAPVTIVEFSDLQCPHCKEAHKTLKNGLFKAYPTQVRWILKQFPLGGHDWAEPAAVAAECAAKQKEETYWSMTDSFFENAPTISSATVRDQGIKYATALKLNISQFKTCLDDPKTTEKIRAQKAEGMAAGVSSTPTLFINGRMKRGFRDIDDLKVIIDEKLKEAKK